MDPRWNRQLKDVVIALLEDDAIISNEYGVNHYIQNVEELARRIIEQVEYRDHAIKVTKGKFPSNDDEYWELDAIMRKAYG